MAKRPKKIVNLAKPVPTPEQTMTNPSVDNLFSYILPQASAEYQYVEKLNAGEIKTSFTPSAQQTAVLVAMEKQKLQESQQPSQPKSQTMQIFDGEQNVTLRLQAQIEAQRIRRAEQAQMALDFKTRTDQEKLQNFINETLNRERTEDTGTNFTQYVSELGDQKLNEMIQNPESVFKVGKLDTPEELIGAGLSPQIVNNMIAGEYDKTLTKVNNINYTGQTDDQITLSNQENVVAYQGNQQLVFTPQEAQNQNDVVTNEAITQINYEGSGSQGHQATDKVTAHEVIATEKAGIEKIAHNNGMLLAIAGIGIMALGS